MEVQCIHGMSLNAVLHIRTAFALTANIGACGNVSSQESPELEFCIIETRCILVIACSIDDYTTTPWCW